MTVSIYRAICASLSTNHFKHIMVNMHLHWQLRLTAAVAVGNTRPAQLSRSSVTFKGTLTGGEGGPGSKQEPLDCQTATPSPLGQGCQFTSSHLSSPRPQQSGNKHRTQRSTSQGVDRYSSPGPCHKISFEEHG